MKSGEFPLNIKAPIQNTKKKTILVKLNKCVMNTLVFLIKSTYGLTDVKK